MNVKVVVVTLDSCLLIPSPVYFVKAVDVQQ